MQILESELNDNVDMYELKWTSPKDANHYYGNKTILKILIKNLKRKGYNYEIHTLHSHE